MNDIRIMTTEEKAQQSEKARVPQPDKQLPPRVEQLMLENVNGYFMLQWKATNIGYYDWIGLYEDDNAKDSDYIGGLNWQWARNGTSYHTWTKSNNGYHARYLVWDSKANTYVSIERSKTWGKTEKQFILWTSNVILTDNVEHSWVEAINPYDAFRCFSPFEPNRQRLLLSTPVDKNSQKRADYCRTSGWLYKDTAGLNLYAIEGYCHQAANRFLLFLGPRNGKYISINDLQPNNRPGGYWLTSSLCGTYGSMSNFDNWWEEYFIPAWNKFPSPQGAYDAFDSDSSLSGRILALYHRAVKDNMSNIDLIIENNKILYEGILNDIQIEEFQPKHREILHKRDELFLQAGFEEGSNTPPRLSENDVRHIFGRVNELAREFQTTLKETIGGASYRLITNNDETIYEAVEIDLAIKIYNK